MGDYLELTQKHQAVGSARRTGWHSYLVTKRNSVWLSIAMANTSAGATFAGSRSVTRATRASSSSRVAPRAAAISRSVVGRRLRRSSGVGGVARGTAGVARVALVPGTLVRGRRRPSCGWAFGGLGRRGSAFAGQGLSMITIYDGTDGDSDYRVNSHDDPLTFEAVQNGFARRGLCKN
jgi:hypothetical protein